MQIDAHIAHFPVAKILVVGDIILDRYWHGKSTRISPEAPVPVVHIRQLEERVGGAANVALNIAALGGHATILGLVGHDDAAITLENKLHQAHVNTQLLRVPHLPTITKLRIIGHSQQLLRLDFEESFAQCDLNPLLDAYRNALTNVNLVVLSDYNKGTLCRSKELIKAARNLGLPILVDPKNKDFSVYAGATIITPNQQEFEAAVGECHSEAEITAKAHKLIAQHDFAAVLVTRSAKGMSLITRDDAIPPLHIPTRAREVYDVTGAGDTVIAALGTALAAGANMHDAAILANAAAGVTVRKLGTATVSGAELRRALQRYEHDPWAGVLTEEELVQQVREAKERGERIIMTNGCFDILHAGHILYLEQAKALGARLIVAVNDDASVQRLKGVSRPINSLKQRMLVLSALRAVDWVVPFSEDTPERLIARILPDVLVKGGDYTPQQIVGAEQVIAAGGVVEVIPFEEGFSTTNVVNKIQKNLA